jgi:hypothetical protein
MGKRLLQRAGDFIGHIDAERGGKLRCRLADQIGLGNPAIERLQRRYPAFLRQATGDPVDPLVAGQRRRCSFGIGGLGIVDEGDAIRGVPPAACGA